MSKLTYLQISFKNSLYEHSFVSIPMHTTDSRYLSSRQQFMRTFAHRDTEFEGGASPSDDGLKASRSYPRSVITSRASAPVRRKPVPRRVKESLPDRAPCHRRRLNAIETSRGQIMGTRRESLHAERACCEPVCRGKAHCRAPSSRKDEITRIFHPLGRKITITDDINHIRFL